MTEHLSEDDLEQIREALYANRKIEAVRLCREFTGRSLRESKDFVDALESELRATQPGHFAQPSGRGCAVVVAGICIVLGAVAGALAYSIGGR